MKPDEHPITANPDLYEYDLDEKVDFVIMGCDGVWEQKTNEEMVAWVYQRIKEGKDNKEIAKELLMECLSPDQT